MDAEGLADANGARAGQNFEVHVAGCVGFIRQIALHRTRDANATTRKIFGKRLKQIVDRSTSLNVHVA
jgi:hypothetical protein